MGNNQAIYSEFNIFFKLTNELKVTAVLLDGIYEKAELKQIIIRRSVKKPKCKMLVPRLAGYQDLRRVHDPTGQTRRVDGAQRRTQLDDVRPDERLRQQARVLAGQRPVVLTCEAEKEEKKREKRTDVFIYPINPKIKTFKPKFTESIYLHDTICQFTHMRVCVYT